MLVLKTWRNSSCRLLSEPDHDPSASNNWCCPRFGLFSDLLEKILDHRFSSMLKRRPRCTCYPLQTHKLYHRTPASPVHDMPRSGQHIDSTVPLGRAPYAHHHSQLRRPCTWQPCCPDTLATLHYLRFYRSFLTCT